MIRSEELDVIIVGGGPAGLCAAMYAGRGLLRSVLLERGVPGGELLNTEWIDDYPGFEHVLGRQLADLMTAHAVEVRGRHPAGHGGGDRPAGRRDLRGRDGHGDGVRGADASSSRPAARRPSSEVPGELEYAGRGVSYCAVCDGAFFKGEIVAVIGGGDAAVEEADYLTRYAEKVYVIHRRDQFRASKILQERLFANPKIEVIWNKRVREFKGGPQGLRRIELVDTVTGAEQVLEATGAFIFIGFQPNTGLVKQHAEHDPGGYLITDDRMMTSIPGLFAAGDVQGAAHPADHHCRGRCHDGGHRGREVPDRPQEPARVARPKSVSDLEVVSLPNGQFAENCYLVADRRSREAVIIDPGEEPAMFLAELDARGWSLKAIWLTHAHIDHIMGVGRGARGHRRADLSPPARPSPSTTPCLSTVAGSAMQLERPPAPDR